MVWRRSEPANEQNRVREDGKEERDEEEWLEGEQLPPCGWNNVRRREGRNKREEEEGLINSTSLFAWIFSHEPTGSRGSITLNYINYAVIRINYAN